MKAKTPHRNQRSCKGFSGIEMMIVLAILAIFAAISIPTFVSARRASRANGLVREVAAQLKLARQEAMSQLRAVTFQYDDQTKEMVVIRHAASGAAVIAAGNYPNNGVTVRRVPLSGGGLAAGDLRYGLPTGVAAPVLGDNTTMTPLPGNRRLNITFHADGSVINANGVPVDAALFLFNAQADRETSAAISVLGAAGRIKIWRYDTNANTYVE